MTRPASLRQISDEIEVTVFLGLNRKMSPDELSRLTTLKNVTIVTSERENLAIAHVPLRLLDTISRHEAISHIEFGEAVKRPLPIKRNEVSAARASAPDGRVRPLHERGIRGQDILIGIIDVEGFDFAHQDFLDRHGRTRFHRIWDQGDTGARPPPSSSPPFDYGAEFRWEHLNNAIDAAEELQIPAVEIEAQSQRVFSSHGTHVASIAAGNSGVCPDAKIAAVLIAMSAEDLDRRRTFSDSTRIAHAVSYLLGLKDELGCKAVSINISLGTNGHAHDGSSAVSRWIDAELTVPGRSVCVAAGNSGQEAPTSQGDLGFLTGRIHTSGVISSAGLTQDLHMRVLGNGIEDFSENELEIWYSPQDRFEVSILPPDSNEWIGPIAPRAFIENHMLPSGTFVSLYNEVYHSANGHNTISIYLSPFFGTGELRGVKPGTWTIRLHGLEVRDGHFHGWIERDDPVPLISESTELWGLPSMFLDTTFVDASSIASIACGQLVVGVANLDAAASAINASSSQGPTRDGRHKPEVGAPGTDIVAANGFGDGTGWVSMSGTSMASPYVAGVVGLMLERDPTLTAAQIGGVIKRTAQPLPGDDYAWKDDAGYGVIDPLRCVAEAAAVNTRSEVIS